MWVERIIANKIKQVASSFPSLILSGARQTGKTSLLKRLFPSHAFVTLDLPSQAELAERKPEDFIRRYPPPVVIDEVQYAPGLFRPLKVWIDRDRHRYGQYLLTGSQKFALMKNVSESLAGRCAVLELDTLSLGEIQSAGKNLLLDVIVRGGFPELHANPEVDATTFYQSYVATYLERDVRQLLNVGQLRDFERFLTVCALRSGNILNKAELARDVGISPTTANHWISVLVASNQIVLLEPWFSNRTKSMVKSPKLYLADSGLLCHLLGIRTAEELCRSPLAGFVWETFVFSELRKREVFSQGRWELHFFRDLRGLEIDFLSHRGGTFHLMEAKFAQTIDERDGTPLVKVADLLGPKRVRALSLICRTPEPYPVSDRMWARTLENAFSI